MFCSNYILQSTFFFLHVCAEVEMFNLLLTAIPQIVSVRHVWASL